MVGFAGSFQKPKARSSSLCLCMALDITALCVKISEDTTAKMVPMFMISEWTLLITGQGLCRLRSFYSTV
jgi:hypothetical protein